MTKKLLRSSFLALAGVSLIAGSANAMLLDFTEADDWGFLEDVGETSQSIGTVNYSGLNVTLSAHDTGDVNALSGDLTFNGNEGPGSIDIGTTTLAGDGDGIGINDDEISYGQILKVAFSPEVSEVNAVYFLDLFAEEPETAWYKFDYDSSTWWGVNGQPNSTFGGVSIGFSNDDNTLSIQFTSQDSLSDFSLAAIDVTPAPEPATMLLFGTGLGAGLIGARRRKKK